MKILIVEDSLSARKMLHFTFAHHNCDIIEAKDGQEGLEMASCHMPDIIISDALMPRMDGFQLLRAIKADPLLRSIPFIFHSSTYTGKKEAELALSLGAAAFIPKPVQPDQLWEKVCTVMIEWQARHGMPAHPEINESDEDYLREYSGIVASKLEEKVHELEEALALREQAEDELRRLNSELEKRVAAEVEQNREKDRIMAYQARLAAMGEMLSNISHQWRQPLNNVALLIQNLQSEHDTGQLTRESLRSYVEESMKEVSYMSQTIDRFRVYYQPDLVKERFSLYQAVTDAISLVREDLCSHGIRIESSDESDAFLVGYKHEFAQVILSAIRNAKEAILESKPGTPLVTVVCSKEGDSALVMIRDNGGGIPVDVLAKVFDPYFTTRFMSQGRGLGLYMSKMIIEKHMGGTIVVGNSDVGTDVTIQMPLLD